VASTIYEAAYQLLDVWDVFADTVIGYGEPLFALTFEDGVPFRTPVLFTAQKYNHLSTPALEHDALRLLLRIMPHVNPPFLVLL
jgi:hypothetical protein